MATYGLNILKDTMNNAWQFGDIRFSKEANDINLDHNTIYPLCLVIEPNSSMLSIYEGWENYSYQVYFCMLWKKEQRSVGTIEQKWDNIQSTANEWLDIVLSTYDNEDLILDNESLQIERLKDFGNDKVLTIKFSFTLQAFRTCFNPKKFYVDQYINPNEIDGGLIEYRTGGGYTYSLPQLSCTAWIRTDGWKTLVVEQGEEYLSTFKDMSAQNYVHPGITPPNTVKHDFSASDLTKADMIKTDDSTYNLPFVIGNVIKSGKTSSVDLTPEYNNWSGELITSAIDNQNGVFNAYDWTVFFVFELPKVVDEFDGQRILFTSQAPIQTVATPWIDIYITNNTIIGDAGITVSIPSGLYGPAKFTDITTDTNYHSRDDTTFAIGFAWDSSTKKFTVSSQRMPPLTSSAIGSTTPPYIWGLAEYNLLSKYGAGGHTNHYTGKFYEAVFYNDNLFARTDSTIKDTTGNPNQIQAIEILNKLSDKYNIEQ